MKNGHSTSDERAIRQLLQDWAQAVRERNYEGILAHHSDDMLMFDVPGPFLSRGIEAYRKTWDLFYAYAGDPVVFDFDDMEVTAGRDVAYVTARMHCLTREKNGEMVKLEFRLTVGLRKVDQRWVIRHEHHSIPADEPAA